MSKPLPVLLLGAMQLNISWHCLQNGLVLLLCRVVFFYWRLFYAKLTVTPPWPCVGQLWPRPGQPPPAGRSARVPARSRTAGSGGTGGWWWALPPARWRSFLSDHPPGETPWLLSRNWVRRLQYRYEKLEYRWNDHSGKEIVLLNNSHLLIVRHSCIYDCLFQLISVRLNIESV